MFPSRDFWESCIDAAAAVDVVFLLLLFWCIFNKSKFGRRSCVYACGQSKTFTVFITVFNHGFQSFSRKWLKLNLLAH